MVKVTPLPAMTPEIVPASLFVIERALPVARLIAAALNVPVLTVNPVRAVVPPTPLPKVVAPPALSTVRLNAPFTVFARFIVSLPLVLVKLVLAPRTTAPE